MSFNQDWLDNLKVGDRVAVMQPSHYTDRRYRFYTVKSISAKRSKFVVEHKQGEKLTLNKYGGYDTGTYGHRYKIEPITDAIVAQNKRANAITEICCLGNITRGSLGSLSDEQIMEVATLVAKISLILKVTNGQESK